MIDPAKPSHPPVFEWRTGDDTVIALPLVNDRLDLTAARLPAGVTLEALSQ